MGNSWLRSLQTATSLPPGLRLRGADPAFHLPHGGVAQRLERRLVRLDVAGSSPVVPAFMVAVV